MCGMTRAEDIAHALALGVDVIGVIFYAPSARSVTVEAAKTLLQNLPLSVDTVAVFVNPQASFVQQVINKLPINTLQFHGDESAEFCAQFARPYIKAMHAESTQCIEKIINDHQKAAAILLDTPSTTHRGGSGKPFDWRVVPLQVSVPIILAGGLDAGNVVEAVKACSPYAVDVCSGVEVLPGIKDRVKMNQFVNALWGNG